MMGDWTEGKDGRRIIIGGNNIVKVGNYIVILTGENMIITGPEGSVTIEL